MANLDWFVVVCFLLVSIAVGLWFTRRASKNVSEFFVGGRSLPWWLAGTSMLATSFASDTPIHTTRAIREGGLAQAWFYWNGIIAGMVIAYVFSKLWRRAGVMTDNELIELRYSGKAAAGLRGGLAMFKSFFLEILTMAWITLGMVKIVKSIMGLPETVALMGLDVRTDVLVVAILLVIVVCFSMASGFWGVVATDVIEFTVAMTGAIVLAIIAMAKVGGPSGLREGLRAAAPMGESALDFSPAFLTSGNGVIAFFVNVCVLWWATNQVDGSGQRAQRFLACKDEQSALAAGIWNMSVQYLIRTWPWYVTALASLVLYPRLADPETAYPRMVADLMPVGLKGLMVASFFAAFMGAMEAHYNLMASYAVNDVYRRFVAKDRDERHYVKASRVMTLVVALLAAIAALLLPSVLGAFRFKLELVAGLGLIYVLRWLWWRINAYSEITALVTSVASALVLNVVFVAPPGREADYAALRLVFVVLISAAASMAATFLTPPEPREHLIAFYRRVRPPRWLWKPIAAEAGAVESSGIGWATLGQIFVALAFVFTGMMGLGKLILGDTVLGLTLIAIGGGAGYVTVRWAFAKPKPPEAPAPTLAGPAAG